MPGDNFGVNESGLCFCTDKIGCGSDETCVRKEGAACFHATELAYNEGQKVMETLHYYGCLPPEEGDSAFQCHGHLSPHQKPKSIACCFGGNYCNLNITPPAFPIPSTEQTPTDSSNISLTFQSPWVIGTCLGIVGLLLLVAVAVMFLCKKWLFEKKEQDYIFDEKYNHPLIRNCDAEACWSDNRDFLDSSSGSGSGIPQLVQRSVGRGLVFKCLIGKGRYGEVYKADRKGSDVAVKVFFTTEEASWKREREIYQTSMLAHENILGFIAADIINKGSVTQMVLITDYQMHGSLHDYLKNSKPLTPLEAIQLAHSASSGLTHLHEEIIGTNGKPAIAHRDIKSKNILVKSPGVAVIADFGLAVKYCSDSGKVDVGGHNTRVGTKRYMAPEVLDNTFNPKNFTAYKQADVYSFGLVLWEIACRIQEIVEFDQQNELSGEAQEFSQSWNSSSGVSSITALPYQCPFEDVVPSDPSFDQMKQIVCSEKKRPPIMEHWKNTTGPALCRLACLMVECWNHNPEARHTALRIKKTLGEIQLDVKKQQTANQEIPKRMSPVYRTVLDSDGLIDSNVNSK